MYNECVALRVCVSLSPQIQVSQHDTARAQLEGKLENETKLHEEVHVHVHVHVYVLRRYMYMYMCIYCT